MDRTCVILFVLLWCCLGDASGAGFELGFTNVYGNSEGDPVTVEGGQVPNWLTGSFIRHSCGAFGETGGADVGIINKVDHLFDCLEMGTGFTLAGGEATFWNVYYNTGYSDIWRFDFDYNMNESKVFWSYNAFSRHDRDAHDHAETIRDRNKIMNMPHVSWWQIGDVVLAHDEGERVVQVYPHNLTHPNNEFSYNDDRFGYEGVSTNNEPAHELNEPDGTLWTNHMVFKHNGDIVEQWRNVFSISSDAVRTTLVNVPLPDIDLTLCTGNRYPNLEHRQGYMHSFTMTENYIILPETSYLFDPCAFFEGYGSGLPAYAQIYSYEPEALSILRVIRKSDGEIMAAIETEAFFCTHQLNAYEQDGKIYADMLIYDNADIYTTITMVDALLTGGVYETHVHRFVIDMSDWSLENREDILPTPMTLEMSNINMDYAGLPYTYAYMLHGIFTGADQILMKVNVDTSEVLEHKLDPGLYGHEPWFVAEPWGAAEDDGVVMMQGLDANKEKGFLMIFDARDLRLLSHVTGSDIALYGLHNKFFWDPNAPTPTQPNNAPHIVLSAHALVAMAAVILFSV